jgi:SAM-dependent methyltransferase
MKKCFLNVKQCKFPKLSSKINNYYTFKKINHRICKNCNLIFHYPINKSSYKKIYNKDYYQSNYTENSKLYHQRKLQYNLDKKEFIQFYKDDHKKKILDYGCGNGEFILKFKSKKYGFEINENIKKNKKINYLDLKNIQKNKFDGIIMRGVIEHIPNFAIIVRKLIKTLKKNGLFFITATPCSNNLSFFLNKEKFRLNDPGHIYHFNNINLSLFFLRYSLYNIYTSFPYHQTPYKNFEKDYKNQKLLLNNFYNKKINNLKKSMPSVGNMMSIIFKKI